jgi:TonB family protein
MLCFLKRVLPFTLTLIIGTAIGGLFNIFSASPQATPGVFRLESAYRTTTDTASGGGGCRTRRRNYSEEYRSARILSQSQPAYTTEARRNQTQGEVILRVTLGADGTVSNVEAITSLPDGLTEQAQKAARQIKFAPALRNGYPVDEAKTITYSFNLN